MTEKEQEMLRELYEAFMESPPTGGPPLIVRIGQVCEAYDKAKWTGKALRFMLYLLPAIVAFGVAAEVVSGWFTGRGE